MKNKDMLNNLIKKKNEELKKMNELDEKWFDERIDFETSIKIREEYLKHKEKFFFYKNMIDNLKNKKEV